MEVFSRNASSSSVVISPITAFFPKVAEAWALDSANSAATAARSSSSILLFFVGESKSSCVTDLSLRLLNIPLIIAAIVSAPTSSPTNLTTFNIIYLAIIQQWPCRIHLFT
ncbi:hypothetical protein JCM11641_000424 [Rhodosporidiobolus odoratus]